MDKNAIERVQNQTALGFFNRLFLVSNAQHYSSVLHKQGGRARCVPYYGESSPGVPGIK